VKRIPDLQVRHAIGYSFPYLEYSRALENDNGPRVPGRSLLPPGTPGRLKYNPLSTQTGHTDFAKSRALLKAAGYAPGEYKRTFLAEAAVRKVLAAALKKGGFDPVPDRVPNSVFAVQRNDPSAPYDLRQSGWCSDFPTGAGSLMLTLGPSSSTVYP